MELAAALVRRALLDPRRLLGASGRDLEPGGASRPAPTGNMGHLDYAGVPPRARGAHAAGALFRGRDRLSPALRPARELRAQLQHPLPVRRPHRRRRAFRPPVALRRRRAAAAPLERRPRGAEPRHQFRAAASGVSLLSSGATRLASTLSMRLPSRSTISKRQPPHSALSPVCGRRPSSIISRPLTVW